MIKKYIFLAVSLVLAAASCVKEQTSPEVPAEQQPEEDVFVQIPYEINVGVNANGKSFYDDELNGLWESGDALRVIQGWGSEWRAGGVSDNFYGDDIALNPECIGSSEGRFSGTINLQTENKKCFHFVHPASDATILTVHTGIGAFGGGLGDGYTQKTTLQVHLNSVQNEAKWRPYMWASTPTEIAPSELANLSIDMNVLNSCLTLRVYENDGVTPKQVKSIRIETGEDEKIIGYWEGTSETNKKDAPSTPITNMTYYGESNVITADNLQSVEPINGNYEYRFNVAPITVSTLHITLTDINDDVIHVHSTASRTFKAGARQGVKIKWDAAKIGIGEATSWWEDYAKNPQTSYEGGILYVKNVEITGTSLENIQEKGYNVTNTSTGAVTKYTDDTQSLVFTKNITLPNGTYTVVPFVTLNGGSPIIGESKTVTVTSIPTFTLNQLRTSYNDFDKVVKLNSGVGRCDIQVNASLSDAYFADKCQMTFTYDGCTSPVTLTNASQKNVTLSVGEYRNCKVTVKYNNDYTLTSAAYTMNVTGLPYTCNSNAEWKKWTNWNNAEAGSTYDLMKVASTKDKEEKTGYATTQAFYVPSSVEIPVLVSVYFYGYRSEGSYTGTAWINTVNANPSVESFKESGCITSGINKQGSSLDPGSSKDCMNLSGTLNLSSEKNYIGICATDVSDHKRVIWSNTVYTIVRNFSLKYN